MSSITRMPAFTPTKLSTYRRCPAAYASRYIERTSASSEPNPTLARAIGAHSVIAHALTEYQRQKTFPVHLRDLVAAQLPAKDYVDANHCESDIDLTLSWVHRALSHFDGTHSIVAVERTFEYVYPGCDEWPKFVLRSTVDLVLEHPDGTIEHIDWKTGSSTWYDAIQTVSSRIVVGAVNPDRKIRSTTIYLGSGTSRSAELTHSDILETWGEIKALVRSILRDDGWLPQSNPLCPFCPSYFNGCSLYPGATESDSMTDWLEIPTVAL